MVMTWKAGNRQSEGGVLLGADIPVRISPQETALDSLKTQITRRALIAMGTSALGLAAAGLPLQADESQETLRKVLPKFSEPSRNLLRQIIGHREFSGQIPASQASELARNEKIDPDKLMVKLIPLAQTYSPAPISNFSAAALVESQVARISQRAVTETVLAAIAPNVKLQLLSAPA